MREEFTDGQIHALELLLPGPKRYGQWRVESRMVSGPSALRLYADGYVEDVEIDGLFYVRLTDAGRRKAGGDA